MNLLVVDPAWGWWIVIYFFLGGIAAGAYFLSSLIDLVGGEHSRDLPRVGYLIAFPLIWVCGVLLILDLGRPERYWHMLFKSEVVATALEKGWPKTGESWTDMVQAPLLKRWSPMSVGSWALLVFGGCSGLSYLGSIWQQGRLHRWLRRGLFGRLLQTVGSLVAFFVAAYTGTLLTATNQPVWSDSDWIGPLFLTSAASTGAAAMLLVSWITGVGADAIERLGRADALALVLEVLIFTLFLVSLQAIVGTIWETQHGKLLLAAMPAVGLLWPLLIHLVGHRHRSALVLAAIVVLAGGFLLRYAILGTSRELLRQGSPVLAGSTAEEIGTPGKRAEWLGDLSPEDGRRPGEGTGADPGNRPAGDFQPASKVFNQE
jgi:formate-dependent nitrite reductase membrane component NrfD